MPRFTSRPGSSFSTWLHAEMKAGAADQAARMLRTFLSFTDRLPEDLCLHAQTNSRERMARLLPLLAPDARARVGGWLPTGVTEPAWAGVGNGIEVEEIRRQTWRLVNVSKVPGIVSQARQKTPTSPSVTWRARRFAAAPSPAWEARFTSDAPELVDRAAEAHGGPRIESYPPWSGSKEVAFTVRLESAEVLREVDRAMAAIVPSSHDAYFAWQVPAGAFLSGRAEGLAGTIVADRLAGDSLYQVGDFEPWEANVVDSSFEDLCVALCEEVAERAPPSESDLPRRAGPWARLSERLGWRSHRLAAAKPDATQERFWAQLVVVNVGWVAAADEPPWRDPRNKLELTFLRDLIQLRGEMAMPRARANRVRDRIRLLADVEVKAGGRYDPPPRGFVAPAGGDDAPRDAGP